MIKTFQSEQQRTHGALLIICLLSTWAGGGGGIADLTLEIYLHVCSVRSRLFIKVIYTGYAPI